MTEIETWQKGKVTLHRLFPDLFEMEVGDKKFHILFEGIFWQVNDITSGQVKKPVEADEKAVRKLFRKFVDEFEILV